MEIVVILIVMFSLFSGVYWLARPRWPAHKHFPSLHSELMTNLRAPALLEDLGPRTDASAVASIDDAPLPCSISFDHINNLGVITYIAHITLHDLCLFPEQATCDPFDPYPAAHSNVDKIYTHADLHLLGHRINVSRAAIIQAVFSEEHAQEVLKYGRDLRGARLRELAHDPHSGDVTFTFHIRPSHIEASRKKHRDVQDLQRHTTFFASIVNTCLSFKPRHDDPAAQWTELFHIIGHAPFESRRAVLRHILAQYGHQSDVASLRTHITNSNHYEEQFFLYQHDPDRFFEAISEKSLLRFVRQYTQESDRTISVLHAISPTRFATIFGPHLPVTVLSDHKIPLSYRVELVRKWLKDTAIDRDALHAAIAQMSDRERTQLRAALEQDSSLSGALSSIDHQGGDLSVHEP